MKKIVVSDKAVGSCELSYKIKNETDILEQKKDLALKALAGLQLMCMSINEAQEE